jgi:hypothetical protein
MLRRLLVALVALVGGLLGAPGSSVASTTTAIPAAISTYDALAIVRARINECCASDAGQDQHSDDRESSAPHSATARGTSTTSLALSNATEAAGETTRVGRWMSQGEFDTMSSTGKVVEGAGGRTYVVEPPNPGAYRATGTGSVYAEFDVPTSSLRPAGGPAHAVIPGPNVTTKLYGPPPAEMPNATCIVWVCRK